jgi:organic radical activating enzyme
MDLYKTLTNLDINLGDRCNLKCVACPCWLVPNPMRVDGNMLGERLSEILGFIEERCPTFEKIMIIGGEPFTHPGLQEFLYNQTFNIYLTIYTNFAVKLKYEEWPENVHFITSLDAADDETYRRIRGAETYQLTRNNIQKYTPWIIHADTTVSKSNLCQLSAIREITRPVNCTHWFLPVDPRMLRYMGNAISPQDRVALHPRAQTVQATADSLREMLLDDDDLFEVERFFEGLGEYELTNDFDMFQGVYLSGIRHFADLQGYGDRCAVDTPQYAEQHSCPGIRKYMEVTLDSEGKFIPVVHCPELRQMLHLRRKSYFDTFPCLGPEFANFADLFAWEAEQRQHPGCRVFCARTQYLGVDEYMKSFSDVLKAS